jgi:hypothetical protein
MMTTLALLLLLAQDPKPAAKTVEDRLKELADKIEVLDKKAATLTAENEKLQQQAREIKARRELLARQPGQAWVKRYAPAVEFTEKQSAEIEEMMYGWTKQDFEKPCDVAGWKAREELLRGKLTPEQAPKLARKVQEEQLNGVTMMVKGMVRMARLPSSAEGSFEKVVRSKMTIEEGMLLPSAHPEKCPTWFQIADIVAANLPELSKGLSESEVDSLRKSLQDWKPKQP